VAVSDVVPTPAGCEHVAPVGLEGADCPLSSALSEPLCPAGTIDPKLDEFAMKKLQRALDLMREGALASKPNRQQRLLDKASRALGKIEPAVTTDDFSSSYRRASTPSSPRYRTARPRP